VSRTVVPARLDDNSYWRRLLATCHPDRTGGDHDLFLFLQGLREYVEECGEGPEPPAEPAYDRGRAHPLRPQDIAVIQRHQTLQVHREAKPGGEE
jgi:hypothetical protein